MHIDNLPNELLLEIFSHFPLKSLIAGQGVCRKWRHFIPLSDISSTRRALLELYLHIVSSPVFPQTRKWTLANLQKFNRQKYIDSLLKQHNYLPEAFRLWILEWPARAVIGCCWPGLPCVRCHTTEADGVNRLEGVNWLGSMPPQVSIMLRHLPVDAPVSVEVLPGLLVWSPGTGFVWLLLDEREGQGGKVYALENSWYVLYEDDSDAINGDIGRYDEGGDEGGGDDEGSDDEGSDDENSNDEGDDDKGGGDDDDSDDSDEDSPEGFHIVYSSWIEWQRHVWREIELAARRPQNDRDWPGIDVSLFGRRPRRERLAMKAWTRRHEPGYLLPFPP